MEKRHDTPTLTLVQLKHVVSTITGESPAIVDEIAEVTLGELNRSVPGALPVHITRELSGD